MITHQLLRFHESFAALVTTLADALPSDQRSFDQQQLLEVAQKQLAMLEQAKCTLMAEPIAARERRLARHEQVLTELVQQIRFAPLNDHVDVERC